MNQQFYETIARFYDAENADMTDDLGLYSELAGETGATSRRWSRSCTATH
jgi:hypothetical protein